MYQSSTPLAAPNILIVDDEALLRLALGDFLESAGFKVVEAANADDAASLLQGDACGIDLVFTDIRMPGTMDGFQLAAWIRDHHPGLPVFLASGDIGKAQATYEVAPGQQFFSKPYDMGAVARRMRDALGIQAHAA